MHVPVTGVIIHNTNQETTSSLQRDHILYQKPTIPAAEHIQLSP